MVTGTPLRIVFFGTPEFAVPSLEALRRSRHPIVGVVTQPDRPRGRGQQLTDAPVKAHAAIAGIPVLQPDRLKDPAFLESLTALGADLGVVAAYGKILTDQVLGIPRLGLINVHASLLPKYRGAAPVHRAVMAGDAETGVTIMRVVKALDAGPMLAAERVPIGPEATSAEVEAAVAVAGAELLLAIVDRLSAGSVDELPQDDAEATYAPRLIKSDGIIDWTRSARAIHDQIRGLHPWPHAFSHVAGRRVIFWASTWAADTAAATPGTVQVASGDRLQVATGSGTLAITRLQAEGKRPMPTRDFLAGHPLSPGARFATEP